MAFCKYCGKKLEDGERCDCPKAAAAAGSRELPESTAAPEIIPDELPGEPEAPDIPEAPDVPEAPDIPAAPEENDIHEPDPPTADELKGAAESYPDGSPVASDDTDAGADGDTESISGKDDKNDKKKNKNSSGGYLKGGLLFAAAVIALILLIGVLFALLGGGYKTPVKKLVSGVNKCRSERIIEAFFPESRITEFQEQVEDDESSWKDVTAELDEYLSNTKDILEDEYFEGKMKVKAEVIDRDKVGKTTLRTIRKVFDEYEEEVSKAYKLKLQLTVTGKDGVEESGRVNVYSVKLKGSGWVLYADEKTTDKLGSILRSVVEETGSEISQAAVGYRDVLSVFGWSDAFDMLYIY
ncbi:MAG: hypothetical protein IJ874_08060 [Ruminococcus sp.]|nr:hypothetical protein [Ruminococcus sp.]